ncbi:hypothetical protein J5226_06930 [Lysobacter sp. K5869]|uniref:hypothetical protein n=1 Tax=Lysobacter sp. K5869 TaxID=2820808 RepID=UPI001C06050F|nr:hypothetical protein [Lysobacter sp. K5869]QWP78123.1 hypothetical protein J5226_06930 [Lysobacter sp. K5869]
MASIRVPATSRYPVVRSEFARWAAVVLCAAAVWPLSAAAQLSPWRTLSNKDGIHLEARRIAGERFDELRVSTSVKVSPDTVADFLLGKYLDARNKNIRRRFIQRGPDVAVWSDVLSAPVAADRCYSMRFERKDSADGSVRVTFASLDEAGAKPKSDCIALRSRGEWSMTPTAGGTRLVYASLTDIGGDTPAFMVRGSLSSAAVSSVRKVVAGSSGLALPPGLGD